MILKKILSTNEINFYRKHGYLVKKELISKMSTHKLRKQFFLGTGNNSLKDNIDLISYAMEYQFQTFLIMPPAYYKGNTDQGVFNFYSTIISKLPKRGGIEDIGSYKS